MSNTYKYKLIITSIIILLGSSIYAQKRIPVIKANSKSVNVRDGKDLKKDAWNISPEIKLDIYLTPNKNKKVTI